MTAVPEAPAKKNPTFSYQVRLKNGKIERGTATHPTRESLIARLTKLPDYETILEVRETGLTSVGKKSRPKTRSLVVFSRMLDLCMSVDLEPREALEAVRDGGELNDVVLKYGMNEVAKSMDDGISIDVAMARHPYIFPPIMTDTLRAGQAGGYLKEAAAQIADDIESEDQMRAKIKKALTYPMVVLALSSVIFVFMMLFVVPKFADLYKDLSGGKKELPALTQMVVAVSNQMFWLIPTVVIGGIITFFWYRRHSHDEKVRAVVDPLKLKIPIFGKLLQLIALTKFCRVLAALNTNGVHIIDALGITASAVGNLAMERAINAARDGKLKGDPLTEPLAKETLFPKLLVHFLGLGEKTGEMAKSLRAVGRLYERDVDQMTSNMEALIQPFFLILIAVMVGIIALAVYLPYFSLGDAVSPY